MQIFENKIIQSGCILLLFLLPYISNAQEKKEQSEIELIEETFQSPILINNQTIDVVGKNCLEFSYLQRFGNINNDIDLFGLYAPANLRLGLDYGLIKNVSIGVGATKSKNIFDANTKILLLNQNTSGSKPVSVAFFAEASRSGMSERYFMNQDGQYNSLNRLSYFSELMVARKFNEQFSLQAALTFCYFNLIEENYSNSTIGLSVISRYKIYKQTSIIFDYDLPFTHSINVPKQNIGLGLEFAGKINSLQLFVSSCDAIINSEFRVCNQNDFTKGDFLIGFNISHRWSFRK